MSMLQRLSDLNWSKRRTVAAVTLGASAIAAYSAYSLYRYHGWFSRAGVRPVSSGDHTCDVKRAVDEYLQFHYATPEEVLPYPNGPKVQRRLLCTLCHDQVLTKAEQSCRRLYSS